MRFIFLLLIPLSVYAPSPPHKFKQRADDMYRATLPYIIEQESGISLKGVDNNHLLLMEKLRGSIPRKYFYRMVYKESKYDSSALSHKRAYGYMQVIPSTFALYCKRLSLDPTHTVENNIIIGTTLLKDLYNRWRPLVDDDDTGWMLAFASYNAGILAVINYGGIPPYRETRNYIKFIFQL